MLADNKKKRRETYAFRAIVQLLILCVAEDGGCGIVFAVFCHDGRRNEDCTGRAASSEFNPNWVEPAPVRPGRTATPKFLHRRVVACVEIILRLYSPLRLLPPPSNRRSQAHITSTSPYTFTFSLLLNLAS